MLVLYYNVVQWYYAFVTTQHTFTLTIKLGSRSFSMQTKRVDPKALGIVHIIQELEYIQRTKLLKLVRHCSGCSGMLHLVFLMPDATQPQINLPLPRPEAKCHILLKPSYC